MQLTSKSKVLCSLSFSYCLFRFFEPSWSLLSNTPFPPQALGLPAVSFTTSSMTSLLLGLVSYKKKPFAYLKLIVLCLETLLKIFH